MKFTGEQERAITLRPRNLLVSAAAGSGKTAVLVERVLRRLTDGDNPLDVDEILVVTFTEAAAEEMKSRIRRALEERVMAQPDDARSRRQLWLLDRADISTIHSFCLRTVRRHFHKLGLDPAFTVLDQHEADLLRAEVMEELLEDCYSGATEGEGEGAKDFLTVVDWFGGKRGDESLPGLLSRLHQFLASLPDPEEWIGNALDMLNLSEGKTHDDTAWGRVLRRQARLRLEAAREYLRAALECAEKPDGAAAYVEVLREDMAGLDGLVRNLTGGSWDDVARALREHSFRDLPRRRRDDPAVAAASELVKAYRDEAKRIVQRLQQSILSRSSAELVDEVRRTRAPLGELCRLALEFDRRYRQAKLRRRGLDFSDLERYCLELLRSHPEGDLIRSKYKEIFVDEYQDINPIQDAIIQLVRGDSPDRKLFMVGDYRQSIYAFRLAEPRIFLTKYRTYSREPAGEECDGLTTLTFNFRSRREILDAVNLVFGLVMTEEVAGTGYGAGEELRCGREVPPLPEDRGDFRVELHLVERNDDVTGPGGAVEAGDRPEDSSGGSEEESLTGPDEAELEALEKEALVVAQRIREITSEPGLYIWDPEAVAYRPCAYRDIVILMRATRNRCEGVLDVLRKAGVPVYSDVETGYFAAREVETVLSLLAVVDNPLQDIPLAAVLRSPIVGLTGEDLARIRLVAPKGRFYYAVKKAAFSSELGDLAAKLRSFLGDLDRWRTMARKMPVADLVWRLLSETGYLDYVAAMPGGPQRKANLLALCDRAREFDSFHRRGLYRFLRFVERLRESEGDLGQARVLGEQENVVRVMSVHKAKGLEFPVVFVMDLGRQFDFKDAREDVLFHRDLGMGSVVVDVDACLKYPTVAHAAVSEAITGDSLAEEMRILYVAMTRARDKLILVGSARGLPGRFRRWAAEGISTWSIAAARTYLDWVVPAVLFSSGIEAQNGGLMDGGYLETPLFKVAFWGPAGLPLPSLRPGEPVGRDETELSWEKLKNLEFPDVPPDPVLLQEIERRMTWKYPLAHLAGVPAKLTVGEMTGRLLPDDEERWTEAVYRPIPAEIPGTRDSGSWPSRQGPGDSRETAVARGIAVHRFLAEMDLGIEPGEAGVTAEVRRLAGAGVLSPEESLLIDAGMLADFLKSPLGSYLRENREKVKREVPFTMRVPAELFVQGTGPAVLAGCGETPDSDYVVVQGTIDVLVCAEDGLQIVDYKTDRARPEDLDALVEVYAPQVSWYALAAESILGKPVASAKIAFLHAREVREVPFKEFLSATGVPLLSPRVS